MITFDQFWDKLVEDEIWWDRINYRYSRKDLRGIGNDTYDYLLTIPNRLNFNDVAYWRQLFAKKCTWEKDAPVKPQLQQVEYPKGGEVSTVEEKIILTGEARAARIKEWLDQVNKVTNNFTVPKISKKEAAEEGQWVPKKQNPYHPPNTYLILVNEAAKKFAGKKYRGLRYIDGFNRYNFGEVSILAENEVDAKDIMKKAERLAKLQLNKL